MSAYLAWLAPQYEALQARRQARVKELREDLRASGEGHARTPEIVANLLVGMEFFLKFAQEVGAITEVERDALWGRTWVALLDASRRQGLHQSASEPVARFLELLQSALASGAAHVAGVSGDEPNVPEAWGWRLHVVGSGDYERTEWHPQGERIGWLADEDLYLEPQAAFNAAKRLGERSGDGIAIGQRTMNARLKERGLLLSFEERRGSTTRREVEGKRLDVLHLNAAVLNGPETVPSAAEGRSKEVLGANPVDEPAAAHQPPAQTPADQSEGGPGQSGQSGQFPDRHRGIPDLTDWNRVEREERDL